MFIKKEITEKNLSHGYLRDKLVKELKEEMVFIDKELSKEEMLRKEILDKIRKGELRQPIPA